MHSRMPAVAVLTNPNLDPADVLPLAFQQHTTTALQSSYPSPTGDADMCTFPQQALRVLLPFPFPWPYPVPFPSPWLTFHQHSTQGLAGFISLHLGGGFAGPLQRHWLSGPCDSRSAPLGAPPPLEVQGTTVHQSLEDRAWRAVPVDGGMHWE